MITTSPLVPGSPTVPTAPTPPWELLKSTRLAQVNYPLILIRILFLRSRLGILIFCLFKAENILKIFLNFRSITYALAYDIPLGYPRSRYILASCTFYNFELFEYVYTYIYDGKIYNS